MAMGRRWDKLQTFRLRTSYLKSFPIDDFGTIVNYHKLLFSKRSNDSTKYVRTDRTGYLGHSSYRHHVYNF